MQYYYESGNYNMAVKTYEKCCKKVVYDLGCPLSAELTDFYKKIVKK